MENLSINSDYSFQEMLCITADKPFCCSKKLNDRKLLIKILNDKNISHIRHSKRVSGYAVKLAKHYGVKNKDLIKKIKIAALLHDIGKLGIPEELLNMPRRLTDEEFRVVKQHSKIGYKLLRSSQKLSEISMYVLEHHERYDGTGYPNGTAGEDISLPARIITIVDSYDAMVSNRPYRKALTKEDAINELIQYSNLQFDPVLVKIFINKVLKIKTNIALKELK